ncbi:MAG TPA: efflux transporter outer membrane subunit [Verrucomicrobiae bacterium]|jgi:NodT family efflux transporter outer membrane factor (OMF) lipoprotein
MKTSAVIFAVISVMSLGWAGGCTMGPKYERPKVEAPKSFGELPKSTNDQPSPAVQNEPIATWWRSFGDPELDRLIAEALKTNYNILIAASRVREARFQRSIIAADLFPNVDADGGYMLARGSKNVTVPLGSAGGGGGGSSGGASGTSPGKSARAKMAANADPPGQGGGGGSGGASSAASSSQAGASPFENQVSPFGKGGLPGATTSLYQVGFDSTWELDVFGGTRKRLEAAAYDISAAVEGLHDVRVSLISELARDYLELRGTQERLAVARQNLSAQNETLRLTQSMMKSGLRSKLDATRAAAEAATIAATIPPLEANVRQMIHEISILVSRDPTALSEELAVEKPLPPIPPEVPVGLPSALIRRRPDIRRSERQIASATALIGSAKADLFPKFGLTTSVGLDSTAAHTLFQGQSGYFLASPTVVWRVFDAGRILSNIRLQQANQQEDIYQYRNAILVALKEVEDALAAYGAEQSRRLSLAEAFKQDQEALRIATDQYKRGLISYLEVLDAQRSLFSAKSELAQSDQSVAVDVVSLYKALGGGWNE